METRLSIPRVDTHFHIFEASKAMVGARYVPAYTASLDRWRSLAGHEGITHGVLVQPSFLGTDNQQMLNALAAHRGCLLGIAVVEPTISLQAMRQMQRMGVRGIRLNLVGHDHRVDEWIQNTSFWDRMTVLDWHLQIHTDPGRLPDVLPQIPKGIRVVIDHMAKPLRATSSDPTLKLLSRRGADRVMVKLSGAYRQVGLDAEKLTQVLLGELGPTALIWGSDWPCTNHEDCADYSQLRKNLDQWVGESWVEQVLSLNPMRLYWGTQDSAL